MPKLTFFVIVMVLAGCASTHSGTSAWRGLRIDGTSESAYTQSTAAFRDLPGNARLRLTIALQEIWSTTAAEAGAEASAEETAAKYRARLDGLGYEEIIRLAGPGAKQRFARVMESPSVTWMPWTGAGD